MKYLFILLLVVSFPGWGSETFNGKSALVVLPLPAGKVSFADANLSVVAHPLDRTRGIVIVPVDYYTSAGDYNITWNAPGKNIPMGLSVRDGAYPSETLSVDPAKVTPPPEAMERIEQEKAEAEAIYATFTPIRYWDKPFVRPMDSNITSVYGAKRTYNGTLKSYHGGVDFRARTPQPILAANDGIVVLAKERYYAGDTVIIDHGEGIYSCYFHLSRYGVKVGQYVRRGDVIGLTGATGRITGPHLHFGMTVHSRQTDPLHLIAQINGLFEKAPDATVASR
ncbi:MAG: M23 family metallopeptidase [Campylobacterota bacterium]